MREPTRKETREILGKLADDQSHSTGDLFPGLKGDGLIKPSEIILRLGETGLLIYRGPGTTGYNKIIRGVAVIKITSEGHQWLEHDRQIRDLAERLFRMKAETINKDYQTTAEAIPRKAAAKGNIATLIPQLAEAGLNRIRGLAGAQIEAYCEALDKARVPLDQSVAEELSEKVLHSCHIGVATVFSTLDEHAKRMNLSEALDAVKAEVSRESFRIDADFKNQIEIKLGEAILQTSFHTPTVGNDAMSPLQEWAGSEKPTLAIVFTDIVGSTEMNRKLGNDEMEQIRTSHFNQARELARQNLGYFVKNTGDGMIAAFHNAAEALNFSLAIHENPGDERVRVRVGMQVGPVTIGNEDAFGNAVNFAARIAAHVKGAEIWLSDRARADVEEQKSAIHQALIWEAHLDQELKDFGKQDLWSVTSQYEQ